MPLPRDWQQRYAPPLCETFVGSASRDHAATDWDLPAASGACATRLSYRRHGRPKTVFVYPLQRDARAQLAGTRTPPGNRKGIGST